MHYDLLPTTLGGFRKVWPDVSLNLFDLSVTEQFKALTDNTIDLCFVGEAQLPTDTGWQSEVVLHGNAMAVIPQSSPLAGVPTLQLKDLAPLPFITMGETFYPGSRAWLQRVCGTAGFIPKISHEVDRAPTMIGLVSLGMGVTLLPETCMKLPHEGGGVPPASRAGANPHRDRLERTQPLPSAPAFY